MCVASEQTVVRPGDDDDVLRLRELAKMTECDVVCDRVRQFRDKYEPQIAENEDNDDYRIEDAAPV